VNPSSSTFSNGAGWAGMTTGSASNWALAGKIAAAAMSAHADETF
jgi:hypothetical protein